MSPAYRTCRPPPAPVLARPPPPAARSTHDPICSKKPDAEIGGNCSVLKPLNGQLVISQAERPPPDMGPQRHPHTRQLPSGEPQRHICPPRKGTGISPKDLRTGTPGRAWGWGSEGQLAPMPTTPPVMEEGGQRGPGTALASTICLAQRPEKPRRPWPQAQGGWAGALGGLRSVGCGQRLPEGHPLPSRWAVSNGRAGQGERGGAAGRAPPAAAPTNLEPPPSPGPRPPHLEHLHPQERGEP